MASYRVGLEACRECQAFQVASDLVEQVGYLRDDPVSVSLPFGTAYPAAILQSSHRLKISTGKFWWQRERGMPEPTRSKLPVLEGEGYDAQTTCSLERRPPIHRD